MAINIFSGASSPKTGKTNSASASTRAKQAQSSLVGSSEVSNSGNTAVGTKNTLAKVGTAVGNIANIASKFLPGVGGTIAKGIASVFNDPEWWSQVPGDAITLNEPLRLTTEATGLTRYPLDKTTGQVVVGSLNAVNNRAAILEFSRFVAQSGTEGGQDLDRTLKDINGKLRHVMEVTDQMATQYLMPQVRKVVNAVTLQDASDYSSALTSAATLYAIWRNLKKLDYMCKHGQTYLANMNDIAFPLFQTANAAWLQSTINRLEEYLRANIRMPHTLCEYLAWRFGRVYKSNDSAKSALVLYNVLSLSAAPVVWDGYIALLMEEISSNSAVQRANTDLYNAYYDHDFMVEVRDDTQFRFDKKEFMLRLNLQRNQGDFAISQIPAYAPSVAIDSGLDNPTTFMASTVSSLGYGSGQVLEELFPIASLANVYVPTQVSLTSGAVTNAATINNIYFDVTSVGSVTPVNKLSDLISLYHAVDLTDGISHNANGTVIVTSSGKANGSIWGVGHVYLDGRMPFTIPNAVGNVTNGPEFYTYYQLLTYAFALTQLTLTKSVDLYNVGIFVPISVTRQIPGGAVPVTTLNAGYIDVSTLSIDAGKPTLDTLGTEHVYAFANLVDIERKHSMSYKQAERLVARDTANLIDRLDVAAAKS